MNGRLAKISRRIRAKCRTRPISGSQLRVDHAGGQSHPLHLDARLCTTLLVALGGLLFAIAAGAQISPGPLSKAHQSLSGPTQCTSCHKFGTSAPAFKCLDCHREIARRLSEQRGLHATLLGKNGRSQDCARCHSEHNGEDFNLVRWEPSLSAFDHRKTGYVLEGKHAGPTCAQCHKPENIREAERRTIQVKDLRRTYLGLTSDCLSCHKDPHRGELGTNCLKCHNYVDWKDVKQFDHSKTRYPLTGAHAKVPCEKCHPVSSGPEKFVKYTGLPFERCTPCHTDPHRGRFPNACDTCHITSSWRQLLPAGRFDHSKTKYPLLGKHAEVRCGQCHPAGDFKKPLAYAKCSNCHKPDPHSGQFRQRTDRGECSACHTVEAFKPSQYGLKEHAASAYPLEGKHAQVACEKCHLPAGKATRYKIPFARCTDCHTDAHKGQFAAAPHGNKCESCHTLETFRPSTFTLERHQATRYPLRGRHLAVSCEDCHKADASRQPAAPAPYKFSDRTCTACHTDPHRGQFGERMKKPRPGGAPAGCEACHSEKSWHDMARFDHSTTSYALVGAHRTVRCADCHKPDKPGGSLKLVNFKAAPSRCYGCHEDVHAGQFSAPGPPADCAPCHNSVKWKPSLFDHETGTTFSLKGAHQEVPCRDCHKTLKQVGGKPILFYKPTPGECKDCHGAI